MISLRLAFLRHPTRLALVAVAALLMVPVTGQQAAPPIITVEPPADATFAGDIALSPDGRLLAFQAMRPGQQLIFWITTLSDGSVRPLPGTEDATFPFWSPD